MYFCVTMRMTNVPATINRFARSLSLVFLPVITSFCLSAQTQMPAPTAASSDVQDRKESLPAVEPPMRFEVVSIHPHKFLGDEPSNRRMLPGGRFIATATNVRTLIRIASAIEDSRMSGAPKWIDAETFDIDGITADHREVATQEQFQQLILSLLEERFEFKFHHEQEKAPVYWLEQNKPGKLGPALKQSMDDSKPNLSTNSNGSKVAMKISRMTMVDVAAALRRLTGRPVEDRTGLKGSYDFQIEWAPEGAPDSDLPPLFTVLKDRLGLRLQPAKGTTETLIIDQVVHPSGN